MSIYDDMNLLAADIMGEFAQGSIFLQRVTPSVTGPAYDPGPSINTSIKINGAVARGVSEKYIRMGLAVASDKQITFPVNGNPVPSIRDNCIVNSVPYKITQVMTIPDSGVAIVYVVIASR